MEINSYFLKITGRVNIPEPVELDKNYLISMNCSVTAENKVTNEDGTYDIVFKIEPQTAEVLKSNGQIIKAKDPRKNSVKIRNLLHRIWSDKNIAVDFEDVYTRVINRILPDLETYLNQVI